ncbi:hypothetical protein BXZ70DRAFT_1004805 [Cristinia sonorae]|uniref:Uncharacterized protein n=1 Tax=Cristinia sonorae TaxID=1940300 RepID=A0A8K0UXI1_9AGAR|nr:hypothetical protein BXZ70DRAFT_1004805 [Cristinia sonorae]
MGEYNHDDFEVVRRVDLYGGYEELRHKQADIDAHTRFVRKAVTPNKPDELQDLLDLEGKVMSDGCSGTSYPVYEHDGKKWVLMSVPKMHYEATGLPAWSDAHTEP